MTRFQARLLVAARLLFSIAVLVDAQSSCSTIAPSGAIKPSIASGYEYAVVATGLTSPRSVQFDSAGNLLVLEAGKQLSSHKLQDNGGSCVHFADSKTLIQDSKLTHGLELSLDGRTVYVSTSDIVYSRTYNPDDRTVGSTSTTLVKGMEGTDHTTRTLLVPRHVNGSLVVSRGSTSNVDPQAGNKGSGVSTVKVFNISSNVPSGGYVHASSGVLLGWGLRNDVGIVEHPATGAIWAVENSVDQLTRDGRDVHTDNPGEELNFLGYLNGTQTAEQGTNFGYPDCLTTWNPSAMPANSNLKVGTPFASSSSNDSRCANTTAPRLTFQAHTAPLDIKFNNSGSEGWVSFHGSWNRDAPVGYSVAKVAFGNGTGEPQAARDSNTAAQTILANQNNAACPSSCLRPVGMAFDSQGRLFVASDASGEIYVVRKTNTTAGTAKRDSAGAKTLMGAEFASATVLLWALWSLLS